MSRRWKALLCSSALLGMMALALLLPTPGQAAVPRWPEPAWFAQFQNPAPQPAPQPTPAPQPAPAGGAIIPGKTAQPSAQELQLLGLCNKERALKGRKALQMDPALVYLARLKSQDMVDKGYFDHASPTYGKVGDMLKAAGIKFNIAGENLASAVSVTSAHNLFMGSSPHSAAILNGRYSRIGVGIVPRRGGGVMVTQIFVGTAY